MRPGPPADTGLMPNRDAWREVPEPQGVRFVLPPRHLPRLRAIGLGIIGVGLVADAAMLAISGPVWWPALRTLASGGLGADAVMLVFPLVIIAGMILPVWLGCLIAFGHAELVLTATHARGVDRAGPFRFRRTVALPDIARLVVDAQPLKVNGDPVRDGPWSDISALLAEPSDAGKVSPLIIAYPHATLAALAEEIRERMGLPVALSLGEDGAPRQPDSIEIVSREQSDRAPASEASSRQPGEQPTEQPTASSARVDRTPESVSITLSPMGFFKGSKGLGTFSIVWLLFVGVFAAISLGVAGQGQKLSQLWPFVGFSVLFGFIGVWMLRAAIRSGRRRAVIDVVGPDLLITRQSTGAPTTQSWSRSEIDRIVVGPSGVEINSVPVMELQIWPASGKKTGLFPERSDDELRWIAAEINAALHTPGG